MKIVSKSEECTYQVGYEFGQKLKGGEIILLDGFLGAGKTVFTKGLAAALNICEPIVSPTFTIMNEYKGDLSLYHFDAYRLSCGAEAVEAGLAEYFGASDGVCVVEWYTNIYDLLVSYRTIKIKIDYLGESEREINIYD